MQNRVGLICGRRGSGKSTTAKEIARYEPRLFVFDPNGEYGDLVRACVTSEEEFEEYLESVADRDTLAVRWASDYEPEEDAEVFCREVYEETRSRGTGATLVIDEAHLLFASAAHTSPELGRVLRLGRHAGLNVVLVTPRLAEISRCATFQADWVICVGTISEPNDVKGLEERTSADFRRRVDALGLHGRALWDCIERRERKLDEKTLSRLLECDNTICSGREAAGNTTSCGSKDFSEDGANERNEQTASVSAS